MHAFLEANMGEKPVLRPKAPIGPAVRAAAAGILADARAAIGDPDRAGEEAVHEFRRSMKKWRAVMRLFQPFHADAARWRAEARDHARALAGARDGQSALNAFAELVEKGIALSPRSVATIRGRLEAVRQGEERAALTPLLRHQIVDWLDAAKAAVEAWPLDALDFDAFAAGLTAGYRAARRLVPADWSKVSAAERHQLRQRVVEHRYQMDLIEPLWPRFGRMWTEEAERLRDRLGRCQDLEILERLAGPHQPLAHWRSRLAAPCDDRKAELSHRAARIATRLFAERPKAFRHRLEMLWKNGR
ncbi:MAG TPA: CHAD domain-containing protein [Xanthobacteraceae bacterium]|nr:CHAD domain-containing protein [Xanthobacteraceae bacterium]